MKYFIGVDEAGYGPNLGPLVITATAWRWNGSAPEPDFYALLNEVVTSRPVSRGDVRRIAIADSKLLYKPGGGLAALERGVLSCLRTIDAVPSSWSDVFRLLDASCMEDLADCPWYCDYSTPIPLDEQPAVIEQASSLINAAMAKSGLSLWRIRSKVVCPRQFNEQLVQHGGKGALLSRATLSLVRELVDQCDAHPLTIQCDKHGGRNRYNQLLQEAFPDALVEIYRESRELSLYRWGPAATRVEARFVVRGERFLPSALASMTCKYLRELAMRAFNAYWRRQRPELKSTAGYPVDARRFIAELGDLPDQLGVDRAMLWRNR